MLALHSQNQLLVRGMLTKLNSHTVYICHNQMCRKQVWSFALIEHMCIIRHRRAEVYSCVLQVTAASRRQSADTVWQHNMKTGLCKPSAGGK